MIPHKQRCVCKEVRAAGRVRIPLVVLVGERWRVGAPSVSHCSSSLETALAETRQAKAETRQAKTETRQTKAETRQAKTETRQAKAETRQAKEGARDREHSHAHNT